MCTDQTNNLLIELLLEVRELQRQTAHNRKEILKRIKRMANELNTALDNIDASLGAVSTSLTNLSDAAAAEIEEVSSLLQQIAAGQHSAEQLAELQSEVSAGIDRIAVLNERVGQIGTAVSNTTAALLADDPAPTVPDLPPAEPNVVAPAESTGEVPTESSTTDPSSGE